VSGESDTLRLDPSDLPPELLRRLVLLCLRRLDPEAAPRGGQAAALMATLCEGGTATLGTVLCRGGTHFRFSPAPPRRGG
jgi:tRNA(Ile)-lysidine synthase